MASKLVFLFALVAVIAVVSASPYGHHHGVAHGGRGIGGIGGIGEAAAELELEREVEELELEREVEELQEIRHGGHAHGHGHGHHGGYRK